MLTSPVRVLALGRRARRRPSQGRCRPRRLSTSLILLWRRPRRAPAHSRRIPRLPQQRDFQPSSPSFPSSLCQPTIPPTPTHATNTPPLTLARPSIAALPIPGAVHGATRQHDWEVAEQGVAQVDLVYQV
jgi:hypothetical protein